MNSLLLISQTCEVKSPCSTDHSLRDFFQCVEIAPGGTILAGQHRLSALLQLPHSTPENYTTLDQNDRDENGLPLDSIDIRKAIQMLFEVCPGRSERAIAEAVGCSPGYVHKVKNQVLTRKHLNKESNLQPPKTVGKDGKSYPAKKTSPPSKAATATKAVPPKPARSPASVTFPDSKRNPSRSADEKESQILETISMLERLISEWFDMAPVDLIAGFEERMQRRIQQLIE